MFSKKADNLDKKSEKDSLNKKSDKFNDKEENKTIQNQEFMELKDKLDSVNDKFLRLQADFENYKKRIQKERLDLVINTKVSVVNDFVSILNDIEIAMNFFYKKGTDNKNCSSLLEGFNLIVDKLKNIFKKAGVEFIRANPGDKFDHNLHMAIANGKEDKYEDGSILKQVKCGYKLHDRVIEPAEVIVNTPSS